MLLSGNIHFGCEIRACITEDLLVCYFGDIPLRGPFCAGFAQGTFFTDEGIICSSFVVTRRELALSNIFVNFVVN